MKKHSFFLMKIAIGIIIFLGVLLILYANGNSFKKIASDDIENISKLSASIIYAEIDNSITKPIFVGQTMANDLFLKKWLLDEMPQGGDVKQTEVIQKYLSDYRNKYGYDSVFLVSNKSNTYYHYEGINKVVGMDNAHDIWYYKFIDCNELYKLDVDLDEANNNELTVFVNCRIEAEDGALLGVVGVGVKMSHLQALLQKYEQEYELDALLFNEEGLIQVDSDAKNVESLNLFSNPEIQSLEDEILSNKASMEIFWYPEDGSDHCLITKYVSNLDWYIAVEKNTKGLELLFNKQINKDLFGIGTIIVLVLLLISYMIGRYSRMLLKTASMDDVTNLPNQKMFQEIFNKNNKRPTCHKGVLFLFDIDHFKGINDKHGHLFGNTVLYRVSEIVKNAIGNKGLVARWGGDEFIGVIYGTEEESKEVLNQFTEEISEMYQDETDVHKITISVGAAYLTAESNLDAIFRKADTAMYRSKGKGRNQITFFE